VALSNSARTVWSARILTNTSKVAVAAGICNRDYEADSANAEAVKITSIVDPTIRSYTGADITVEDIDDSQQSLLLDQKKYFAFYLDDVERAQTFDGGRLMAEAIDRAAYGLANTMDALVLDKMVSGVSFSNPDNNIEEITVSTAAGAYDHLVDLSVLLDSSDVPPEQRWAVVPPQFYGLLLKDSRFVSAGDAAGAATRANGRVGEAAGMAIYKSNNLPTAASGTSATNKFCIAGSTYATTLAEQVRSLRSDPVEKKFAEQVKGLHVYGVKVTRPSFLAVSDVRITA